MRNSIYLFGLCLAINSASALFSDKVMASPAVPEVANPQILAEDSTLTLLRFETQHYLVRVFSQGEQLFINVYNKETGYTDQNRVPAYVAPPENANDKWRTYVNQRGDLEYRARVNPEGRTELEIRVAGGEPAQPEVGFNATYSFPHVFLGEDLEATLQRLKDTGWTVDSTEREEVALSRNQMALDLGFNPNTEVVTYTRLLDLG